MIAGKTMRIFIQRISILAFAAASFASGCAHAQGLYNDTNLYINGASLHVDGDVVNSGRIENDGSIGFTRDWQSEGKYKGHGELRANGNTPQKIQHYEQKVNTLMIEGWGTKYIRGMITVTGTLHLITGVVEVASGNVLKLNDGALAQGGSPDSYVDGPLTVQGKGYKFFPIGKHGTYAPIEFLDVQGDGPEFSVELFDNAPILSVEDVIVRKGLYWQRTDNNGGFGGSAIAIDFERSYFQEPEKITLLAGTDWKEPFATIFDLQYSDETDKISTPSLITAPIIMLGEISERWTEADFYFSTALSPNASRTENHNVKIFGDRLADDKFRFQVFNRWGAIVYETTSLESMRSRGWDGRNMNGVDLTSGTYPYRLTAFDKMGTKFEKAGVITIIH